MITTHRFLTNTLITATFMASAAYAANEQIPAKASLDITANNYVFYVNDASDFSKLSSNPAQQAAPTLRTFSTWLGIGDITTINGEPARGTFTVRGTTLNYSPAGLAGSPATDTTRNFLCDFLWEIQTAGGVPVGTITATGVIFGPEAPAAPGPGTTGAVTITGGTGAYLGVRGQAGVLPNPVAGRGTSATEDPSVRRILGGGARRLLISLMPGSSPEVLSNATGPLVVRSSDYSQISAANPARPGEALTLYAGGLGPVTPALYPGQLFPVTPVQVAGQFAVQVNDSPATVTWAGGYPGTDSAYQVNFVLPANTAGGRAPVRLIVAWMVGSAAYIPVKAP